MTKNIEELKNKIYYRASYRGTKEMDILMVSFVKSVINQLNYEELEDLSLLVNLSDEKLIEIKHENSETDTKVYQLFKNFKI